MAGLIRVVNGSALVTACTAVTAISLSANNVGFGAQVTLYWSGARSGAGNPIRGYEVYRGGVLLMSVGNVDRCTVTSPTSNGSYTYAVKTLGSIAGFDAPVSTANATLTSVVSAPTAPTAVSLSATDVRIGKSVTLSWGGAKGGTNNLIAKYHVYRNGAYLTETTATSCAVSAAGSNSAQYTFTVYAIGSVSGWNSGASGGVVLTAHTEQWVASYFTASGTYTVPSWAERVDVSCISGGGSGSGAGEGNGGCGGGSGYISHYNGISVTASQAVAVTVGAGGASSSNLTGYDGGMSSFAGVSSVGGKCGALGSGWTAGTGGNGGAGGGGGGRATWAGNPATSGSGGAGLNTVGGRGISSTYGVSGGSGGGFKGTNGTNGSGQTWGGSNTTPGIGANTNEYYCFSTPSTQHYLNATGGNGGAGTYGNTPSGGGYGGQVGKDASGNALIGTGYGKGGEGGHESSSGNTPSAPGGSGLVAVRAWRYLS